MIHLDTNVAIALINGPAERIRAALNEAIAVRTPVAASVVVYHELMFGAAGSVRRDRIEMKVDALFATYRLLLLPFDLDDAREAADIRAHLKAKGAPIGPFDLLIAAQARRAGAALVTANAREFERVPGLQVVDWSKAGA